MNFQLENIVIPAIDSVTNGIHHYKNRKKTYLTPQRLHECFDSKGSKCMFSSFANFEMSKYSNNSSSKIEDFSNSKPDVVLFPLNRTVWIILFPKCFHKNKKFKTLQQPK